MAFAGLARTPPKLARLLSEGAASAVTRAEELTSLAARRRALEAVPPGTIEAERLWARTVEEAGQMLGGTLDRDDILAIGLSVKELSRATARAADVIGLAPGPAESWVALASVARDCARQVKAAIDRLDGPDRDRAAHLTRAGALHREGGRLLRATRSRMVGPGAEPVAAAAADVVLGRLERVLHASRGCARAIERVTLKHA